MKRISASINGAGPRARRIKVVDVVEPLGQVVELAPRAAAADLHHAPIHQTGKLGAALAGPESGPFRDLARVGRFPEIGKGEIHPSLLRRERIEVALEILGMVVDQIEKIGHQLAERQIRAEPGHNGEQPRAAASQIRNAWIVCGARACPDTVCHRVAQSSVSSGCNRITRNSS